MVYIYDAVGQPIGMSHFQDDLYEKNIHGDVVAVYDYDGNLVVRYAYNAWGAVSETEYGSEYDEESFEEETIGPGARVDGIDYGRKIIYELKPNNSRAIRRGIKQLERYIRIKGDGWRGELITYD